MTVRFLDDQRYSWTNFFLNDIHAQSYFVFDIEGTGIDHTTEYVIQIGAVPVEQRSIQQHQAFSSYVRSPKPIPPAITRLTGIHQRDIETAPSFPDVFQMFSQLAAGRILVTQCGYEYDYRLLQQECQRGQLAYDWPMALDTKALFALLHPELDAIFSTDFLVKYYDINTDAYRRHDALGDAQLIAELFLHILAEYEQRGIGHIDVGSEVHMRRFVLPPLPAA